MTKLITLGEKFRQMDPAEQINHLHKLASSLNQALELMQIERNELLARTQGLQRQLENCEQNLSIQKKIVQDNILQGNAEKQALIKQNQALGDRVRTQDAVIERLNGQGHGA